MRKIVAIVVGSLILLLCANDALGQKSKEELAAEQFEVKLKRLKDDIVKVKNNPNLSDSEKEAKVRDLFGPNLNIELFASAMANAIARSKYVNDMARSMYVKEIEESRLDKQVGGDETSSGSSSLVSKGSVPSILGFAVENGAITRDISGTTITFRGNPVGIIKALSNKDFIQSYDDDSSSARFLRRLSFAVSFDTKRGMDSNGNQGNVFTGDSQQLSSYSFRFDLYNKRDPRHSSYDKKWNGIISNFGQKLTDDAVTLCKYFRENPTLGEWLESARTSIVNASASDVDKTIEQELDRLADIEPPTEIKLLLELYKGNEEGLLIGRAEILEEAANAPIISFEYLNTRRVKLADLSTFKVIAETGLFKGKASLTGNASFTILNALPPGRSERKRNFQISAQMDIPINLQITQTGNFVLSFSGMYKRKFKKAEMMEDDMMNVMAKDRSLDTAIGQIKLTIPIKGSGVKIPLSVTFANRTELIKEKEVKGNIGITFDLDSLFSKFKN